MRRHLNMLMLMMIASASSSSSLADLQIEDLSQLPECWEQAERGDHLMIKYKVIESHTGEDVFQMPEGESFHMQIGDPEIIEGLNIGLEGICEGTLRRIKVPPSLGYEGFSKKPPMTNIRHIDNSSVLDFYVTVENVTKPQDYQIFEAFNNGNMSEVIDLITSKQGINAVDEWGSTPLMMAVSSGHETMVASLLNAWRPRVDVNARKPSGYNALIYASANKKFPSIVRALLQRGADPNVVITAGPSAGWTALHFAVKFEALPSAQVLLEYGANPMAVSKYGTRPMDLVPGVSPRWRVMFQKLLQEASDNWRSINSHSLEL